MSEPDHLSVMARRMLDAPIRERVDWILADAWFHTPCTRAAFQWMGYMYRCGPVVRPPCLQIVGEGGMGKTATLLSFADKYPIEEIPGQPLRLKRPVVYAECKAELKGEIGVRDAILRACWPHAEAFECKEREVDASLRAQGVRVLLLDEFGELTKAGIAGHRRALSELKRISNANRVGIVAATVTNLAHVLDVDQQFASRFKRKIVIPPWSLTPDLRNFVFALERNLPLPERSFLDGPEYLPWIAAHGEGNTKEIIELVRLSALHAMGLGASHIDRTHLALASQSPLPPSIVLGRAA